MVTHKFTLCLFVYMEGKGVPSSGREKNLRMKHQNQPFIQAEIEPLNQSNGGPCKWYRKTWILLCKVHNMFGHIHGNWGNRLKYASHEPNLALWGVKRDCDVYVKIPLWSWRKWFQTKEVSVLKKNSLLGQLSA